MTKLIIIFLFSFVVSNVAIAASTKDIVAQISQHVGKIYVSLDGAYGLGSGVVVAKDKVVTNCHVVANAQSVKVMLNDKPYQATGVIPDWQHDVCVLTFDTLDSPSAHLGSTENLQYEQPLYSIGFAGRSRRANATYGVVKGLYPLDDSVVVRTTNTFRLGDSGGGLFDEDGNLVGLIAVKSPGRQPNYYYMSVQWIKQLMGRKAQKINVASERPFWAEAPDQWPYFMRVVHPLKTQNWARLAKISEEWLAREPNTLEAIYYGAVAAYKRDDVALAQARFNQVVRHNKYHGDAYYYLGLIAFEKGNGQEMNAMLAMLDDIDEMSAKKLRNKMRLAKK